MAAGQHRAGLVGHLESAGHHVGQGFLDNPFPAIRHGRDCQHRLRYGAHREKVAERVVDLAQADLASLQGLLDQEFGDILATIEAIKTGDFSGLSGSGAGEIETQMDRVLADLGFDDDTLSEMATSGNPGANRVATQATTGALVSAAAQNSYEDAGQSLARVDRLVGLIDDMDELKESIDLNTRVTAELAIALVATIWGIVSQAYVELIIALLIGGTIGLIAARRVQMTQMPELVAILHSLVGLAAVAVGFANFLDPGRLAHYQGVDLTIHDIETYLGILIGAVTFSGSVIAFGKLSGKIGGKPMLLPARHWLNLGLLIAAVTLGIALPLFAADGAGPNREGKGNRRQAMLARFDADGDCAGDALLRGRRGVELRAARQPAFVRDELDGAGRRLADRGRDVHRSVSRQQHTGDAGGVEPGNGRGGERADLILTRLALHVGAEAFDERMAHEFLRWKRYQRPLALSVWDVDRFKRINDGNPILALAPPLWAAATHAIDTVTGRRSAPLTGLTARRRERPARPG